MFLANTPKSISEIENAIPDQNFEVIRQAAHKAKPSFNYVGLKECSSLAAKIEEFAKKNENGVFNSCLFMQQYSGTNTGYH